jgi:alpha-mannosidase
MMISAEAGQDVLPMIDALVLRVQAAQFVVVAPLAITRWLTAEPAGFAERESGERAEVATGEPWAGRLFDCAWMRFSAQLPAGVGAEGLVARIDVNGELCVVDRAGVPVRGLTNIKSTFDPVLGGPGKTLYRVPAEAIDAEGRVVLWADAGLNDLFGFVKDEGRVVLAELVRVREDVRQLYYDLETLRDFWVALPAGDERRWRKGGRVRMRKAWRRRGGGWRGGLRGMRNETAPPFRYGCMRSGMRTWISRGCGRSGRRCARGRGPLRVRCIIWKNIRSIASAAASRSCLRG